ncbi:MAG: hypothetical protein MJ212_01345 [Alphaproteobacteria bacterium]|nr:hypothetical protein [Alphaproteobacteria bacterium]
MSIDMRYLRSFLFCLGFWLAIIFLCYVLMRNPYKAIHEQIFATADTVRSFYRDQPGYWKLSTESAQTNGLIKFDTAKYNEFKFDVGNGINGDMIMPGEMQFDIALKNLNKSACIGLSEMPIKANTQLGLQKITVNDTEFSWGEEHSLPIKKYKTRDICQPNDNVIVWTFR